MIEEYSNCKKCIRYIKFMFKKSTFYLNTHRKVHIALPFPYVAPNHSFFKYDQFYWDSYFIILGLLRLGKIALAKGIVNNFAYLFRRYGIIPARNRYYNLGMSQPPFLTSMALAVYEYDGDKEWLLNIANVAEKELKHYWQNKSHLVYKDLSRYADHFITHLTAEHESGWDMTSRFQDRCLDFLPIDLNTLLYKYEKDLSEIYGMVREKEKKKEYSKKARERAKTINKLMWDEDHGMFFDYDYVNESTSSFYSVASYYPLWAELADKKQAKALVENLSQLEYEHGIANTQKTGLIKLQNAHKQHDYPSGWAHQQWIIVKGLLNYGYEDDAYRIASKWVKLNKEVFDKTKFFWERYDVVNGGLPKTERYGLQKGFGWTNAVFILMLDEFSGLFDKA